ncbi:hypothetical protein [Parachitinimonas caeni]|uniref:Lipoprotein n=1 Tax=Parachitinimonas caeni TaxID=3031301 RepID=A0ABT7DZ38_9NEIS|nr:hypothetical protein [Parachitinimonas caeni]MDK2125331.1 hypothetical protein [Parachitinimonas caeni]
MRAFVLLSLNLSLLTGCASMLPSSRSEDVVRWHSYEELVQAFNAIQPQQTDEAGLRQMGLHPDVTANITHIGYAEFRSRYAPDGVQDEAGLDAGLRTCLQARQQCHGYKVDVMRESRQRVGNFLLDFLAFKKVTDVKGWRFMGWIAVVNGKVVFREYGGTPSVSRQEESHNPLGPLQGIGESMRYR